jgi:lysyl-tRNA synthetase class 2
MALSEQAQIRRAKLEQLQNIGINPWPADGFTVTQLASAVLANFRDEDAEAYTKVGMAGRVMAIRDMGKAAFLQLQDSSGRIQLYINRDEICPGEDKSLYNQGIKKLLDIGDIVGVNGFIFRTRVGEITLHVQEFSFLSKSLRPLPIVKTDAEGNIYDAFADPELRYRMRYVDLIVNAGVKETFLLRSKLVRAMRQYFDAQGWMEVETPVLQPIHGGAAAKPFVTHHNSLDIPLFLRIANELYLKRLIVGGIDGVYEMGKMFRNEGMDRTHNPEFTSVELYVAYKDYTWMMTCVEECLATLAHEVTGSTQVKSGSTLLNFQGPYPRLTMYQAIQQYAGVEVSEMDETDLRKLTRSLGIEVAPNMGRGKLIDAIFGEKVEHHLIQPTFITDYPLEMTPLAKKHRNNPDLVERFELFVNGKEIANAYTELNDPIDQRQRFADQLLLAQRGDEEAMELDEDFIRALEYGMPPTAGLGIGIDRLVMLFAGKDTIQEVLLFPQMRPEKTE